MNTMAQAMGRACLADSEYMSRTRTLVHQEREFLFDRLAALPGLHPFPSVVNYLLVKLTRPGMTAASLAEADAGPPHRHPGRQQFSGAG